MHVCTEFHAVGQGLFSFGVLFEGRYPEFTWVYDCGSTSDRLGLDKAIAALGRPQFDMPYYPYWPRKVLDLVVLSHFDRDHVNGFTNLMNKFRVDTLLIPLVPFAQRLEVLFSTPGYVDKASAQFLIDPVATIRQRYGDRVRQIILVPPSEGGDGIVGDGEQFDPPPNEPTNNNDQPKTQLRASGGWHRSVEYSDSNGPPVFELSKGARLMAPADWEFIPYVEAWAFTQVRSAFSLKAEKLKDELLETSRAKEHARKAALKRLKDHYKTVFDTPEKKNRISLFLYGGRVTVPPNYYPRASLLYCGDGDLSSKPRWDSLERYLTTSRLSNLRVLQVAHHGSRNSWHSGLANAISPDYAVFSADPSHRHGHPHQEVEQDFSGVARTHVTGKRKGGNPCVFFR